MKPITYTTAAIRALRQMPASESAAIRSRIEHQALAPGGQANTVHRLRKSPYYRLDSGNWRVIFSQTPEAVAVVKVRPRGGV